MRGLRRRTGIQKSERVAWIPGSLAKGSVAMPEMTATIHFAPTVEAQLGSAPCRC